MKRTRNRKKDSQQSARFVEVAKEVEADESGEAFERAFKKIATRRPPRKRKKKT